MKKMNVRHTLESKRSLGGKKSDDTFRASLPARQIARDQPTKKSIPTGSLDGENSLREILPVQKIDKILEDINKSSEEDEEFKLEGDEQNSVRGSFDFMKEHNNFNNTVFTVAESSNDSQSHKQDLWTFSTMRESSDHIYYSTIFHHSLVNATPLLLEWLPFLTSLYFLSLYKNTSFIPAFGLALVYIRIFTELIFNKLAQGLHLFMLQSQTDNR